MRDPRDPKNKDPFGMSVVDRAQNRRGKKPQKPTTDKSVKAHPVNTNQQKLYDYHNSCWSVAKIGKTCKNPKYLIFPKAARYLWITLKQCQDLCVANIDCNGLDYYPTIGNGYCQLFSNTDCSPLQTSSYSDSVHQMIDRIFCKELITNEDTCCICLGPFLLSNGKFKVETAEEEFVKDHKIHESNFHKECITKWMGEKSTCPYCRKKLKMKNDEFLRQALQYEEQYTPRDREFSPREFPYRAYDGYRYEEFGDISDLL